MKLRHFIMVLALALLPASVSHASLIATFSGAFPIVSTPLGPLDQFNPMLGTLSSVEFIFTTSGTGNLLITDGPGNPDQTVDVNFGTHITLFDSSSNALVDTTPVASVGGVVIPGNGVPQSFILAASNVVTTATLTDPALLSQFIGTGSINLLVNADGQASTTPGLAVPFQISGSGQANGSVEIIYHVSSVPEPLTMMLAGCGLLGIGFARKVWRPRS